MWSEGSVGGAQAAFLELLSINPKGGVAAKSIQPIGPLFGPGSGESGRDIDSCRIMNGTALRQVGAARRAMSDQ
jgi:hypothetical protein